MLKKTVTVLSIFALCVPALGSRPLTNNEVLDILHTLTVSPMKTWIPAGTIEATHTEYRAPKTTDTDVINSRITRELLVAAAEHATEMRVIEDKSVRESRRRIYRMQVEAMAHNVRYELANESNMQSSVTIKYDGDRFYWEINVGSRSDSITTPADLVSNGYARRFDLNWNQQRVFVWDGENYIHYYRPGNHAIVTHERGNVNGPLTAGIVPWGYGVYTYANLSTLPVSGVEMDSGDIELTITDPEWQEIVVLDPAKGYALKSRTKTAGDYVTYVTYGNHTTIGDRFCPTSIVVEEYDMTGGSILMTAHTWNITSITDQIPAIEAFAINYETDALIEDYPTEGDRLMYRYAPPMPPEARYIDMNHLLSERLAVVQSENDEYRNCATVALQHVANRLGKALSLSEASQLLGPTEGGVSLASLQIAAEELGLYSLPVTTDLPGLAAKSSSEAILHLAKDDHYVVLGDIDDQYIRLIDLTSNNFYYRRPLSIMENLWDGTTMLLDNKRIALSGGMAKLDATSLDTILGAAAPNCQSCTAVVQDANTTPCSQTEKCDFSPPATRRLTRKRCEDGSPTSSCYENTMAYEEESLCVPNTDPNGDPGECVPDGEWETLTSGLACEG